MTVPRHDAPATSTEWAEWGTYVHLAVADPEHLERAEAVTRAVLEEVGRACSRFRADSDLVRANRAPGTWVTVDPLLIDAVRVATWAAETTDGLVTPCLGRALVALGYDADLGVVRGRAAAPVRRLPAPDPQAWREVGVAEDAVRVPAGCELDLGATAKAWAADLVAGTIAERLGVRVLVSLGGDLRVDGPGTDPWPVRVTERRTDSAAQLVEVSSGGIATSTTLVRRWLGPDGEAHHLLDPRTNLPVGGSLRTVTAAGRTCLAANVASTAALVLGEDAPAWLAQRGVSARLVHADGTVSTTVDWPAETRAA